MDKVSIIFRAAELVANFIPKPKPPKTDFSTLIEALPDYSKLPQLQVTTTKPPQEPLEYEEQMEKVELVEETPAEEPAELEPVSAEIKPTEEDVSTSCIACSRSHLTTAAGALEESMRFAREGGITHPEVIRRLDTAEKEITIMERIDLSPESILRSRPEEQQLARDFLPKIRKIRQDIGGIRSVTDLENLAAQASVLSQEFRLRDLQLRGVDLNPVLDLARKVQAGEITMEEAKVKLKEYLPEEE